MANLTLRETLSPSIPGATTLKSSPLTNNEVDGNFVAINNDITTINGTLTGKAPLASPTFTGTVVLPSTTSIGTVSSVEIGYLDGVTSAIQTQLNGLSSSAGSTNIVTVGTVTTGIWQASDIGVAYGGTGASTFNANSVLLGNGTSAFQTVAPGTSGNILTSNGTTWVSSAAPEASGATITNDISTNTTQYIGMSRITTGAWTSAYVASTQLTFNPSTGTLNSAVFNSTSDERMKENIRPLGYGLAEVLQMTGKKFEMKDSGVTSIGLIAQELNKIIPEVVSVSNEETGMLGVNYPVLVSVLIEAIKELELRVKTLENT